MSGFLGWIVVAGFGVLSLPYLTRRIGRAVALPIAAIAVFAPAAFQEGFSEWVDQETKEATEQFSEWLQDIQISTTTTTSTTIAPN